jgi:hypothetical protein
LVDLAGSEKMEKTEAAGKQVIEGTHINISLINLGAIISTLADQSLISNKPMILLEKYCLQVLIIFIYCFLA